MTTNHINWYIIDEYTKQERLMTEDEINFYVANRQSIIDEEWHTENGGF